MLIGLDNLIVETQLLDLHLRCPEDQYSRKQKVSQFTAFFSVMLNIYLSLKCLSQAMWLFKFNNEFKTQKHIIMLKC